MHDLQNTYFSRYSDSLRAGRSEDRIPVRFNLSAPVKTRPEAHLASYKMSAVSSPLIKHLGRGVNHPPASSAEVKEKVEL